MDLSFIPLTFPHVPQVQCLFQTRMGGYSQNAYAGGNISFATKDKRENVLENRKALYKAVNCPLSELSQVHGNKVIFEPQALEFDALSVYDADGHATSKPNFALMIKTADCQPILFAHKTAKYIMALHVGWRANKNKFILSAVDEFCEYYKLKAQDLYAVRGPSLGPDMAEFINFDTEWGDEFQAWFYAKQKTMDLWGVTRYQLQSAGLLPSRILGLDMCTASMNDMFFSYRKEKESGRQASLIWIKG